MDEQREENDQVVDNTDANVLSLTTDRLILRTPHVEDADAIAKIANNRNAAVQTRRLPHPYNVNDALVWIEAVAALQVQKCAFLITRKCDNAIIGTASFFATQNDQTEIGYWIGEPYWGKGFATEAAHAVIDYVFTTPAAGTAPWSLPCFQCSLAPGADEIRISI